MNGHEFFNRFQLNRNLAVNNKVNPVTAIQMNCFVVDGQGHFSLKLQAAKREFMTQAHVICGLQQSWPQLPMNLTCSRHDFTS